MLPVIKHPIFKTTVPSTKATVSYRPYTVQEEKLLLIMKMSSDIDEIIGTVKQIIRNCVLDEINVDKLAMFDVEYLFLNIRKVSVSNVVELNYSEEVDGKIERVPFTVDLDQVQVKFDPEHTTRIQVSDAIGITMNYPTIAHMLKLEALMDSEDADDAKIDAFIYDMFLDCVESVYDENGVYKDFEKDELDKFINSLPADTMKKIRKFFDTMPSLQHEVNVKFSNGEEREVRMKGLKDFFIF